MQAFAGLYEALDGSTATGDKVAALVRYFAQAAPQDAAWAVYFLAGGKPRQLVPMAVLRETACRQAGVDEWLFDECYQAVGDLAETIAHILPPAGLAELARPLGLAQWVQERLLPLRGLMQQEQSQRLVAYWGELDAAGRYLLIKLIGGGFRVGVSKLLVQRALAQHTGLDAKLLAQRLVGWTDADLASQGNVAPPLSLIPAGVGRLRPALGRSGNAPSAARWQELVAPAGSHGGPAGQPYPFFLAHPLQAAPDTLGPLQDWLVEWKYDGMRAQLVKRAAQVWIWSRGEELVSERFPEVVALAAALPDGTVLDGELLVWLPGSDRPAPFKSLQTRINRKLVGKKLLTDAPVRFMAYDLLEREGVDQRMLALADRRMALLALLGQGAVSPVVQAGNWAELAALRDDSRARAVEGLMLKSLSSRYGSGRTKSDGTWWKWKVDPLTVDAVLIYAQAGHGRRAGVYTDYSFAVWSRSPAHAEEAQAVLEAIARREPALPGALQLLPFAKAYSGLSDEEFKAVDRVIRATTLEKFGPVRSVRPTLVFEIGFEGINASPRHKSGVAVRFPRMLRLRADKPVHEADTLGTLMALILH